MNKFQISNDMPAVWLTGMLDAESGFCDAFWIARSSRAITKKDTISFQRRRESKEVHDKMDSCFRRNDAPS